VTGAIRIGEPGIEVRLRRHARARRMILRVARAGGGPVLTLPPGATLAAAHSFLRDQEAWLRRQIEIAPGGMVVSDGTMLPFRGETLTIRASTGRGLHHENGVLSVAGPPQKLPARVHAWLREAARQDCVRLAAVHARALGREHGRITLRDTRSRWGSCTSAGDLMFSWRLVLAPAAVLDYVVAHEVAHLAELNHSRRFWDHVARLCPGHAAPRRWLRGNGAGLHAWDFTAPPPG
jgi:predicted metal-dependent hydrolase